MISHIFWAMPCISREQQLAAYTLYTPPRCFKYLCSCFCITAEATDKPLNRAWARHISLAYDWRPRQLLLYDPGKSIKMEAQHDYLVILLRLLLLGCFCLPALAYLPDVNIFTNYRTEVYNGQWDLSVAQSLPPLELYLFHRHTLGYWYNTVYTHRR